MGSSPDARRQALHDADAIEALEDLPSSKPAPRQYDQAIIDGALTPADAVQLLGAQYRRQGDGTEGGPAA